MKFLSSRLPKFNDDTDWRKDPGCLGRSSIHTPSASSDRECSGWWTQQMKCQRVKKLQPESDLNIMKDLYLEIPLEPTSKPTDFSVSVCFWRYIVHYNDPSLSFGLFPVWPHFYLFFVSASWLFPFGCLCCLDFMLVRCQTCVRLNEASRCREAHGPLMNALLCYYQMPDSSQSLRCFLCFTPGSVDSWRAVKILQGISEQMHCTHWLILGCFWNHGCIYVIKNTIKTVILWNNITN